MVLHMQRSGSLRSELYHEIEVSSVDCTGGGCCVRLATLKSSMRDVVDDDVMEIIEIVVVTCFSNCNLLF